MYFELFELPGPGDWTPGSAVTALMARHQVSPVTANWGSQTTRISRAHVKLLH